MKKLIALVLTLALCLGLVAVTNADDLIKVGIINNPPSESGYRAANVADFEKVFCEENGYSVQTKYAGENDDQLEAAKQFINDGVDYLLISAAETTGWEAVLKDAKEQGIGVFLFDRMIDVDPEYYEAAVVSDMASEGKNAVQWLVDQKLPEYKVVHIQGKIQSDAQIVLLIAGIEQDVETLRYGFELLVEVLLGLLPHVVVVIVPVDYRLVLVTKEGEYVRYELIRIL